VSPVERAISNASVDYTSATWGRDATSPEVHAAGVAAIGASLERTQADWREAMATARCDIAHGPNGGPSVYLPSGKYWLGASGDIAARERARRLGQPVLDLTASDVLAWREARVARWARDAELAQRAAEVTQ